MEDKLWAPWRIEYIRNDAFKPDSECFFCKYQKENKDEKNLVLHRGNKSFVLMNHYPYTNGHLMVSPYQHTGKLNNLDQETRLEIINLIDASCEIVRKKMNAGGFNVGLNLGEVAGAGFAQHIHFHIVPRWKGDTNFMPVTGHTKVISEGMQQTYSNLKPEFEKL